MNFFQNLPPSFKFVCRNFLTRSYLIAFLFFGLFFGSKNIFAKNSSKIITTTIKADFIDVKRRNETINLLGNVTVEKEDLSIKADSALVYYYEKNTEQSEEGNSIKKIEATDNIKIFNGEFVATGKYAVYDPQLNNLILEENVIFNNGTSIAKGEKFIYDLKTKKGNLIGTDKKPAANQQSNQNDEDDGRVIVIIDDNDLKKSNSKSKK